MQDPTAPVVPPVAVTNSSANPHTLRLIILGVLLVLIIGAVAFFWKDIMTAVALRDVRVAEAQYRDITVKKFSFMGLQDVKVQTEQALGDYATGGSTKVAIVGEPEGAQDIVLLSDEGRALTSDGMRKAALSVSADGTKVAYAVLTNPRPEGTFDINMARWTVRITDVATGKTQELGTGFGPEFFVRDGSQYLFFTTPTQVAVYDIENNVTNAINFFTLGGVDYAGHISVDGMHLAIRSGVTGKYDVFAVESVLNPITLKPLGTVETQLTDAQWVGDELYGLTDGTSSVISVSLTDLAHPQTLGSLEGNGYYRFIR